MSSIKYNSLNVNLSLNSVWEFSKINLFKYNGCSPALPSTNILLISPIQNILYFSKNLLKGFTRNSSLESWYTKKCLKNLQLFKQTFFCRSATVRCIRWKHDFLEFMYCFIYYFFNLFLIIQLVKSKSKNYLDNGN